MLSHEHPKELLDDHRALEPPDPIPNSAVKRCIADGSVGFPHVRVGHRQAPIPKPLISIAGRGHCFCARETWSGPGPSAPSLDQSCALDGAYRGRSPLQRGWIPPVGASLLANRPALERPGASVRTHMNTQYGAMPSSPSFIDHGRARADQVREQARLQRRTGLFSGSGAHLSPFPNGCFASPSVRAIG